MNLYHCMIELKSDAKALPFARAVERWMGHLTDQGMIAGWKLWRRKFGLASGAHPDFLLEIEVEGMAQLDEAFRRLAEAEEDDEETRRYDQLHQMIARLDIGLYRPYPDAAHRERVALV